MKYNLLYLLGLCALLFTACQDELKIDNEGITGSEPEGEAREVSFSFSFDTSLDMGIEYEPITRGAEEKNEKIVITNAFNYIILRENGESYTVVDTGTGKLDSESEADAEICLPGDLNANIKVVLPERFTYQIIVFTGANSVEFNKELKVGATVTPETNAIKYKKHIYNVFGLWNRSIYRVPCDHYPATAPYDKVELPKTWEFEEYLLGEEIFYGRESFKLSHNDSLEDGYGELIKDKLTIRMERRVSKMRFLMQKYDPDDVYEGSTDLVKAPVYGMARRYTPDISTDGHYDNENYGIAWGNGAYPWVFSFNFTKTDRTPFANGLNLWGNLSYPHREPAGEGVDVRSLGPDYYRTLFYSMGYPSAERLKKGTDDNYYYLGRREEAGYNFDIGFGNKRVEITDWAHYIFTDPSTTIEVDGGNSESNLIGLENLRVWSHIVDRTAFPTEGRCCWEWNNYERKASFVMNNYTLDYELPDFSIKHNTIGGFVAKVKGEVLTYIESDRVGYTDFSSGWESGEFFDPEKDNDGKLRDDYKYSAGSFTFAPLLVPVYNNDGTLLNPGTLFSPNYEYEEYEK